MRLVMLRLLKSCDHRGNGPRRTAYPAALYGPASHDEPLSFRTPDR